MAIYLLFVQFIRHPFIEFLGLPICFKWLATVDLLTANLFDSSRAVVCGFNSTKPPISCHQPQNDVFDLLILESE